MLFENEIENNRFYQLIFKEIRQIINRLDPAFLMDIVPYEDEYDYEVGEIIRRLAEVKSIEEIERIIYEVFEEAFDAKIILPSNSKKYKKAARKIWMKTYGRKQLL